MSLPVSFDILTSCTIFLKSITMKCYVPCETYLFEICKVFFYQRRSFQICSAMLTFLCNALLARGPQSSAKMVAGLDDVCDRPRSHN